MHTLHNYILQLLWYLTFNNISFKRSDHSIIQFFWIDDRMERSMTMKKFIDENTKSPDICLWSIVVINETLRSHVNGWTYTHILEIAPELNIFLRCKDCKSKISYLGPTLTDKNIGNFQISMNNILLCKIA